VGADEPIMMLTAIIPATAKVLRCAGLGINDIDAFEVNEAFSPVVLAWHVRSRRHRQRYHHRTPLKAHKEASKTSGGES